MRRYRNSICRLIKMGATLFNLTRLRLRILTNGRKWSQTKTSKLLPETMVIYSVRKNKRVWIQLTYWKWIVELQLRTTSLMSSLKCSTNTLMSWETPWVQSSIEIKYSCRVKVQDVAAHSSFSLMIKSLLSKQWLRMSLICILISYKHSATTLSKIKIRSLPKSLVFSLLTQNSLKTYMWC